MGENERKRESSGGDVIEALAGYPDEMSHGRVHVGLPSRK